MSNFSTAQRRIAHEQALANTRIEGHVPTPEFLRDCEAVIAGTMTNEEAIAASRIRALALNASRTQSVALTDAG